MADDREVHQESEGLHGGPLRRSLNQLPKISMSPLRLSTNILLACSAILSGPTFATAQSGAGSIERLDPALDSIVSKDAKIEKVAGGFEFIEAPLWRPDGHVWFSDVLGNVV